MRRLLGLLAPVVLALLLLKLLVWYFAPDPAEGANMDRCVTDGEFRAVDAGMSRQAVQRILDGPGRTFTDPANDTSRWLIRHYPYCGQPYDRVRVVVMYRLGTPDRLDYIGVIDLGGY